MNCVDCEDCGEDLRLFRVRSSLWRLVAPSRGDRYSDRVVPMDVYSGLSCFETRFGESCVFDRAA
jgi:hypothetical protein